MTLNVSPKIERLIQAKLDTGEFIDVEHLLFEALDRMDDDSDEPPTIEEWHTAMTEAEAQVERGETYSGAEARAWLAEQSAMRQRARRG